MPCDPQLTTVASTRQKVDLTKYTETHEFIFDECFDEKMNNREVTGATSQ